MHTKAKRNWFKERADAVRSTAVREGYQRYTSYFDTQLLNWVKEEARRRDMWVTDVIGEALNEYKKRADRRQGKAGDSSK